MITQSLLDRCLEKPIHVNLKKLEDGVFDEVPYDLVEFCVTHKVGIQLVKMKYDWMLYVIRKYGNARKIRLTSFYDPKDANKFLKWAAIDLYEKG